ncbi:ABC transporter substrate-binding protein [uncultured Microbulbifer sp.]|uniref:ABC transporter substrate-binding protein n=1 Tax=uncultured Microbulbifer sp. TaxID=348147 RepID=UPI002636876E|nr:ABC transporter substrate-binding protein [uncultured Microbulbifer sp.]
MPFSRRALIQYTALWPFLGFALSPTGANGRANRLVIADEGGDRGLPAPFLHHKDGIGYLYTSYIFDTLIAQDRTGKLVGGLARAWQLSSDGLSCTITLRDNIRWHDGSPLTAKDVVFTVAYMAKHPYLFVSTVKIARAVALSANRLNILLREPDAGLLSGTLLNLPILPEHLYAGHASPERFTSGSALMGSGPYRFSGYDRAEGRYFFKGNTDYYRGDPLFDQMAIVTMGPDAALRAMRSGEVDLIPFLPYDRVTQARSMGFQVVTAASNHVVRLLFNNRNRFQDRDRRHALAFAIHRKALIETVRQGEAAPAETGFFQPNSPWGGDTALPPYAFDPQQAQTLLSKSGWSRDQHKRWCSDGEVIHLTLVTDTPLRREAVVVSEQLESIGLSVDVRILERTALREALRSGNFDLSLLSTSTMGDPSDLARYLAGDFWNGDYFAGSREMTALLEQQAQVVSLHQRKALLAKFQALYAYELPSYMLFNPNYATAHNHKIAPRFLPDGVAIGIPTSVHKSVLVG